LAKIAARDLGGHVILRSTTRGVVFLDEVSS
jgi:hypothetical protein